MKWIKYERIICQRNTGTEEKPTVEDIFEPKMISYCEANEEIAKREAYNGEYTIEDDGQPETTVEPTTDDILNALLGVTT